MKTEERGLIVAIGAQGEVYVQLDELPEYIAPVAFHPHELEVCW